MPISMFGGNAVKRLQTEDFGLNLISDGPFKYYHFKSRATDSLQISELCSFSVFVYRKEQASQVFQEETGLSVNVGDLIQAEGATVRLNIRGGRLAYSLLVPRKDCQDLVQFTLHATQIFTKSQSRGDMNCGLMANIPITLLKRFTSKQG